MDSFSHHRGGFRKGAGRPKKRPSELQQTHSIRATKKDWKMIQGIVRTVKSHEENGKQAHLFFLDEDESRQINRLLLEKLVDELHGPDQRDEQKQEESPSAAPLSIEQLSPESIEEKDAVSLFLAYFRLNPKEATLRAKRGLEHEQRIREIREERARQADDIRRIDESLAPALHAADAVNNRREERLNHFGQDGNDPEK